ncbi:MULTISPECIES: alpha/beta fold hydrolase [unclassified Shewanella]|uniref:alpha/beta fold hydrolase n=1 Tax=unclassified Shewanella TaxID=196818 RepID=UPI001BC50D51|nr:MULTISPECIES: alpha/beta hydrolase [unclassified Shewanella]GIU18988.1 2-succinyl-6-hydroxy-2,4-cyclohexadiene-1-carboxy late synthase [Shewanella sp. MBTL60-112-B1]GIU40496.1 2-succinyl-6-hydroxy-2,4-cyclohexadiene-1-carboxy late synthase [Shewanella sp. MBTL60-112-B2]
MNISELTTNFAENTVTNRHELTIEGSTLSYLDIGQGPVLLMGHSYLWDSEMWAPQIAYLSQNYRCIVPDLWGHGFSGSLPTCSRNLRDIASQMLELMDALNIEKFSVIGLSVGAMWGAELALKAPARVQSLVMLGSFIGYEPEITRDKYYAMLDVIKAEKTVSTKVIDTITPLFFANQPQPELVALLKQKLNHFDNNIDTLYQLGRMIFGRRDTMDDAHLFTLPCLIMTGVEDKARSVLEGYLMHDAIDASKYIHIPDCGHISTLEQADFVNQQLSQFLATHH